MVNHGLSEFIMYFIFLAFLGTQLRLDIRRSLVSVCSQGLSSLLPLERPEEAEKRDPGNEVEAREHQLRHYILKTIV